MDIDAFAWELSEGIAAGSSTIPLRDRSPIQREVQVQTRWLAAFGTSSRRQARSLR